METGKSLFAIAVALVGIIIGAIVLIIIQGRASVQAPTDNFDISESMNSDVSETSQITETEKPTTGETLPAATDSPDAEELAEMIIGEWSCTEAYITETNEPVELEVLYGSGYKTYGGVLIFREDKTFSVNIGITNNGDKNNGKYFCYAEKIAVTYNNDSDEEFIPVLAPDETIEKILVPQNEYTVVFIRK